MGTPRVTYGTQGHPWVHMSTHGVGMFTVGYAWVATGNHDGPMGSDAFPWLLWIHMGTSKKDSMGTQGLRLGTQG